MDTTPQDLLIVALERGTGPLPEQGDLSLALAGAELIDLLRLRAVQLDDTRILPNGPAAVTDRLLAEAAAAIVRQLPFESVEDWLWRRGRGLAAAYTAAIGTEDLVRRSRPRFRRTHGAKAGGPAPAESAGHRAAVSRWTTHEPVLTALAAALGIGELPSDGQSDSTDDDVTTVLATVHDAVRELDAVRQRRAIEEAAFANIWRGAVG